jgi:hypothetical protein
MNFVRKRLGRYERSKLTHAAKAKIRIFAYLSMTGIIAVVSYDYHQSFQFIYFNNGEVECCLNCQPC